MKGPHRVLTFFASSPQARKHILEVLCRSLRLSGSFDLAKLADMSPGLAHDSILPS